MLLLLGFGGIAGAQVGTAPAPTLTSHGAPLAASCNAINANLMSLDLDAKPGYRVWFCHNDGAGGAYAWEQLKGARIAVTTTSIGAASLLPGVTTVTLPVLGAVAGTDVALAAPLGTIAGYDITWHCEIVTNDQVNVIIRNRSAVSLQPLSVSFKIVVF